MKLRERKKARTRERLAEVALALFERDGFEGTTVETIAGAAEVSRRTFFRYFPTKEAALFSEHARRVASLRSLLDAPGPPLDVVRRAFSILAVDFAADRERLLAEHRVVEASSRLIAYERELDLAFEELLAERLGRGRDAGNEGAGRRARLQAGAVMGLVRAALREWFASGCTLPLEALAEEALSLLETWRSE